MLKYLRLGSTVVRAALAGIAVVAGGIALVRSQRDSSAGDGGDGSSSGAAAIEKVHLHVVPRGDGWEVTQEGVDTPIERFDVKEDAVEMARDLANRSVPASLTVHRSDGTIQRHHEYEAEE